MDEIFPNGFYSEALFNEEFVEESFRLENGSCLGSLAELPLNSLVKFKDNDLPASTDPVQYHQMTTYSSCTRTTESRPLTGFLQSGKTEGSLNGVSDICLAGNTANGTWNANVTHTEGRPGHARGQPLKKIRRLRANDRERRRMRSLNRALESLKKCLPVPQSKRRVTKLEILRIACNYIRSLSDTLSEDSQSSEGQSRGKKSRSRGIVNDPVVNGFSVAQRLEILSGSNSNRI